MSKYHQHALRNMALQVIEAWHDGDCRFNQFMRALQARTGLNEAAAKRLLTRLAGY